MQGSVLETRTGRFFWSVTARPRLIAALGLGAILAAAACLPRLARDTRAEAFIRDDHPAVVSRDHVKKVFGLADPVAVAVINEQPGGVFNPHSLRLVEWLTRRVGELPGVDPDRVTSLASVNNIVGTQEGLVIEPFLEPSPETEQQAEAVRRAVMDFEPYVGNLVAPDGRATLILAELLDERWADEVYARLLTLADQAPVADEEIHVAGEAAISAFLGHYIDDDARRFNPVVGIIITCLLFVAYRTLRGIFLPGLVVAGGVVIALGSMAAAGVPLYIITNALPPVLIGVAVADGIHILGQYYEEVAADPRATQRELVVRSMVEMWRPVTVTTVTDVAGFMAIYAASTMPPMKAWGLFAAVGVLAALGLSLFVLPALLVMLPRRLSGAFAAAAPTDRRQALRRPRPDRFGRVMSALGRRVVRRPAWVLAAAALVTAAGVAGAWRLEVDEARIENFKRTEPIHQADRAINRYLNGSNYLDVVVETPSPDDLLRPENLRRIEGMQDYLETLPHVRGSTSIVDYLKQMNGAMNENRRDAHRLPDSADLTAQYLLLYSMSGDPADLAALIDHDYQTANVRVTLDSGLYSDEKVVVEAAQQYLREQFDAPGVTATLTGRVNVDYQWISELARTHVWSVTLALVAVTLMAAVSFRSAPAGLLTVVPVGLAVLLIYAVMGFAGIRLGIGTSMFAAIAIGTGVDFAVHTLDRLRVLLRDERRPLDEAFSLLFGSTGRALLFSFAAVLLGFGVLVTSRVPGLIRFGSLVAVGISVSFVASMTVLPALVRVLRPAFLGLRPRPAGSARIAIVGLLFLGVLVGAPLGAQAQAQEAPAGAEVVKRINARDEGEAVSRTLVIELIDHQGKKRVRKTRMFRKYYGQQKRTAIFYLLPEYMKGTAYLMIDYPEADRDDDRWLYLPADRRIRRIAAADRGARFLGTDFTHEDIKNISKVNDVDYTHTTTGEEMMDGRRCYVLESKPVTEEIAKEIGYGRVRSWVDAEIWMVRKSEFWDVNGNPLKTVHTRDIRRVHGIWTAHLLEVRNHKRNHGTVLRFSDVDYESGVDDALLKPLALRRGI